MSRMVNCIKLGKELPGLDKPPVRGELGERIFQGVSKEAWKMWIGHSTMLINEYRLEAGTPEAMKIWLTELEKYFFGDGSKLPDQFVPPSEPGKE